MLTKLMSGFHNWRNSLVGQLLLRFWVCHIIFFTLIGSIQYHSLKNSLYQSVEQNLLSDYHSIRSIMINWLMGDNLPPGRFAELRPGNFVAFYGPDAKLRFMVHSYGKMYTTMPDFMEQDLKFNLYEKAVLSQPFVVGETNQEKYMLMVKPVLLTTISSIYGQQLEDLAFIIQSEFNTGDNQDIDLPILGYAMIGEPLTQADLLLDRNLRGYILNALVILLLSTLLTAFALQKPLEPLLNISSTARKIAGGRYNLRIPYMKTSSDIEQLRGALNHMLGQMENALNTERKAKDRMARFIADASHELRTPLTSIRGFLEILQRSGCTDRDTLDSAHKTMLIETERLIRLTEGLLTLNRISQEAENTEETQNNTSTLCDTLPELMPLILPLMEERVFLLNGCTFTRAMEISHISLPDNQIFPLKTDELKQILYNLLNNSIQHTEPHGTIEIRVEDDPAHIRLLVKDNGKGITPEDLPHIFERFFRGDRSRARTKGQGSGLGLAIVSELVRLRGGEIDVESELGQGTTITLYFPKANSN